MSEAWLAFARNGDPNRATLPHRSVYRTGTRSTMLLNVKSRVANQPYHQAGIWRDIHAPIAANSPLGLTPFGAYYFSLSQTQVFDGRTYLVIAGLAEADTRFQFPLITDLCEI